MRRTVLAALLPLALWSGASGAASDYPQKPLRWIVPYAAGGPTERVARVVGQALTQRWGQQIVVDLRPGANSIIGTELAVQSAPDGYTMLLALPALAINQSAYRRLPYDGVRDFEPVTLIASASYLLLARAGLPAASVKELVALAKQKPGALTFGSGGVASPAHLAMELLMQKTGLRMVHVPYKGGAPALTDLLGGQIDLLVNPALSSLPHVRSGKLKALAVTSTKRSRILPQVPTVSEEIGAPYDVATWYGLFAPAGTPSRIVATVSEAVKAALAREDVAHRLSEFDADPVGSSPAEFKRFVADEVTKWREVIRASGVTLQ